MIVSRLSTIIQVTTSPTDLTVARAHTGGWSESIWTTLNANAYRPLWSIMQQKRALLLPLAASIVGFRTQIYTISTNKILPGGAVSGRLQVPGTNSNKTDLPQVSLQLSTTGAGVPNTNRLVLRGIPDDVMKNGEYQPDSVFKGLVTQFATSLLGNNFGFVGRDLSQLSVRVEAIAGTSITVDQIPGTGLDQGDYVRLNRVIGDNGSPIQGVFKVNSVNGRVLVMTQTVGNLSKPSGTLHRDLLAYFAFGSITPIRAVVKKIGRPFESYRGRRSKTT